MESCCEEYSGISSGDEDFDVCEDISLKNRFVISDNGENGGKWQAVTKKRKKASSSSSESFANLSTDEKLNSIFAQLNKNFDKISDVENTCRRDIQNVNKYCSELEIKMIKMGQMCEKQEHMSKVLCYRSIDIEARSMRNNLIFYGVTEKFTHKFGDKHLVLRFLENELDINTEDIVIERAHRLGRTSPQLYRDGSDQKRPLIARFRDYNDTEVIMRKVYLLKNSGFGIDRQYPKEISTARSALYKSKEAVDARSSRRKVQIRYPAKLFIDGRCVKDMFPEWFNVLGTNRLVGFNTKLTKEEEDVGTKSKSRAYSNETIVDTLDSSVFIEDNNASSQIRPAHTNINNPETRSGTCDELTECKETVDLPECAQQSTSRQKKKHK